MVDKINNDVAAHLTVWTPRLQCRPAPRRLARHPARGVRAAHVDQVGEQVSPFAAPDRRRDGVAEERAEEAPILGASASQNVRTAPSRSCQAKGLTCSPTW